MLYHLGIEMYEPLVERRKFKSKKDYSYVRIKKNPAPWTTCHYFSRKVDYIKIFICKTRKYRKFQNFRSHLTNMAVIKDNILLCHGKFMLFFFKFAIYRVPAKGY